MNRRRIKPCQIPSSPSAFPCLASSRPLTQSPAPAPALFSQLSADSASVDVLDNGNTASLLANLKTAFNLISQGRLTAIRVFTASGTYTPSAGTKRIKVTVIGGGGGGGGSAATDANTRSCGAGGGAGNTAISLLDVSSLTLPVSVNVGTAGAAGAAGGGSGGSGGQGGTTTFGTYINATGGFGGGGGSLASDSLTAVTTNGGTSAAPTTGNILNQRGSAGLQGIVGSNAIVSGAGGASSLGGGGNPVAAGASTAGENGIYGGGGSGSISIKSSQIGRAGGAGGVGVVVIEEYA
ncbi:glycine-rich domain-containing protein [Pantoea agglomerans]